MLNDCRNVTIFLWWVKWFAWKKLLDPNISFMQLACGQMTMSRILKHGPTVTV